MFSQILSPQPRRSMDGNERPSSPSRTSIDKVPASALADTALSNLRKSLASKRSSSPASVREHKSPKSTLEDRLRASFAIGDVSSRGTPEPSSTTSPIHGQEPEGSLPSSIPLPESPHLTLPPDNDVVPLALSSPVLSTEPPALDPLGDIPLLDTPPDPSSENSSTNISDSEHIGVESLQHRLKLVEQRFNGELKDLSAFSMLTLLFSRCIHIIQKASSREACC
jgi:hypothetical protein